MSKATTITPIQQGKSTVVTPPLQVHPKLEFSSPIKPLNAVELHPSGPRLRLAQHMSVLKAFGHSDLSAIGDLTIGSSKKEATTVIQRSGALIPTGKTVFQTTPRLLSGVAMRSKKAGLFEAVSGGALVTDSKNLPVPNVHAGHSFNLRSQNIIPINVAYWFGTSINIADDTTVILDPAVKSLFIITDNLIIGERVSITWDMPPESRSTVPSKPLTPGKKIQSVSVDGERGSDGIAGVVGGQGNPGQPAPEIELWFLQSSKPFFPAIYLRGQDGFQGINGGDGGDGGEGGMGSDDKAKPHGLSCDYKQKSGGNGGNGARPGDGGRGGDGGAGGKFAVFAPQIELNKWLQGGLTISVDGGGFGAGGDAGRPGEGGSGGDFGNHSADICGKNKDAKRGINGNTGPSGSRGPDGSKGLMHDNSIQYSVINQNDFILEAAKPYITSVGPGTAYVGDTVSVNGDRFIQGDQVFIEGVDGTLTVPCITTFVSQSLLTIKVPSVPGGYALVEVQQQDLTRSSSQGTLMIRPRIDSVIPSGRVRPGEYYYLRGTGFGRNGSIWINGENIGLFELIDNTIVKFKARRPSNAESNPSGENVKLKIVNAEGAGLGNPNHSAEIDIVLDTFRILVFGDSAMWGGGLPEYSKYYSLAADYMASKMENIGVYKTIKAHHGAKIGRGDNTVKPEMPGEMSSRWPTILQQVDSLSSISDAAEVDLILLNGGANDLPITDVMMKTSISQLEAMKLSLPVRIREYCFTDMVFLLQKVLSQFPKAKVIVPGYFHIISEKSNPGIGQALIMWYVGGMDLWEDSVDATVLKAIALSNIWISESNKNLSDAVQNVNDSLPGEPRVSFVNLETTPDNAANAPLSLLWEPDGLGGPTDPMWQAVREAQREENKDRLKSEPSTLMDGYFITKRNSSFHPNVAGAHQYFEKMKPVLDLSIKSRRIALRCSNGKYLDAVNGGNAAILADGLALGPSETFELIDLGNSKVALKSLSGYYVCADNGTGPNVSVDRLRIGGWETFTMTPQGLGFTFKTSGSTGGAHFLSVPIMGPVTTAGSISQNTTFTIV